MSDTAVRASKRRGRRKGPSSVPAARGPETARPGRMTLRELRARLAEAEENLRAIRSGEVDALIVQGPDGEKVYTLKDADRAYRAIIEEMLEGAVTLDRDGSVVYANAQLARMLQTSLSALIGSMFLDHVHPSDRPAVWSLIRRPSRRGRRSEVRLRSSSGAPIDVLLSFSSSVMDGVPLSIGVLSDVGTLKSAQAARRELGAAVEQTVDAVVITDLRGVIVYANRSYEAVRNAAPGALVGRRFLLFEQPRGPGVRAALGRDGSWSGPFACPGRDRPYDFQATVSSLRDDPGRVIRYVAILHDVSERLKLEKQLQSMQRTEALGRLAGGIAHDLNNILFPIILNTEWLLSEAEPGTPRYKALDEILQAANRQRNLVKQILTFGRRRKPELRAVKMGTLLDDALAFMRSSLPTTIEIWRKDAAEKDTVLADPDQLHQIVINLCQNAAEAMGPHGGRLEVSLTNVTAASGETPADLKAGEWLRLSVKDSGRGIPAEDLDRIFDPFFTTKEGGTGLGLSIVHGALQGLGGSITVESRKGKGTRFDAYLPSADGRPVPESPDAVPVRARGKGARVLLVDDEPLILESAGNGLELLGYRVTALPDGPKALHAFRGRPRDFDLVILDQTMPRMTGAQLATELRAIRPDIPIILMTGYSQAVDEEKARALGIRRMLMKPMSISDLSGAVASVLGES